MTAGATVSASTVGALSVTGPREVTLKCQGGGATTYDISDIVIRTHDLG